jgi:hypothetical protein
MRTEFVAHAGSVESWKNKTTSDAARINSHYETIQHELNSLKRIHHLTAQYEQHEHRFEEMVSFIQQYLHSVTRSVCSGMPPARNGKTTGPSRPGRTQVRPAHDFFAIDPGELGPKVDLGAVLKRALVGHQAVSVAIPSKTAVVWNQSVSLFPGQAIAISGSRGSQIVMEGWSELGDLADPSRVILDGFCWLTIVGIRIHALCDVGGAKPTLDLNALFVGRNDAAVGVNTVEIKGCQIETDIPVVNVGGNSVTHITITDGAIRSNVRGRGVLYPVTAEFGSYTKGFGSVSTRNVATVPPGVEWLICDALSHPKETDSN